MLEITYQDNYYTNVIDSDTYPSPKNLMDGAQRAVEEYLNSNDRLHEYRKIVGISVGEAHGEPVILRILRLVREGFISNKEIQFYVNGQLNPITEDGDFEKPWPNGFFEWRAKELF